MVRPSSPLEYSAWPKPRNSARASHLAEILPGGLPWNNFFPASIDEFQSQKNGPAQSLAASRYSGDLKRRGLFGSLLSLAGVELLTYGISGHHTHELLGIQTKDPVSKRRIPFQSGIQVEHSISINAPIDKVYSYFRDFQNLPHFMRNIRSVEVRR